MFWWHDSNEANSYFLEFKFKHQPPAIMTSTFKTTKKLLVEKYLNQIITKYSTLTPQNNYDEFAKLNKKYTYKLNFHTFLTP